VLGSSNSQGQQGLGTSTAAQSISAPKTAVQGLGAGKLVHALAVGNYHCCVILSDKTTKCFGNSQFTPLTIQFAAGRYAVKLAATASTTCALLDNGAIRCWSSFTGTLQSINVEGLTSPVAALSVPYSGLCALLEDGSFVRWPFETTTTGSIANLEGSIAIGVTCSDRTMPFILLMNGTLVYATTMSLTVVDTTAATTGLKYALQKWILSQERQHYMML
jgi:hypothetical protein